MKSLIGVLFSLCALNCIGQHRLSAKIYQNTDFFPVFNTTTYPAESRSDKVNFSRFSLALNIQSRHGHTHEIELFIPEVSKPKSAVQFPMEYHFRNHPEIETVVTAYAMRYEVNRNFTSGMRFRFNLGIGLNPYYTLVRNFPKVDNIYYSSTQRYGTSLNFIPRIKCRLNNHFTLEASIPVKLVDFSREAVWIANPAIPNKQQTTRKNDLQFFEKVYTFRLGLRYNFSSKDRQVKNKRTGLFDSDSFF